MSEQPERYEQQLTLPQWGAAAQEKLAAASVFVVGVGARGSVAASYLAAAGVGLLALVDGAQVDRAELARQPWHFELDITAGKADALRAKLSAVNPEIHIDSYPADVEERNSGVIFEGATCVVDCTGDREASLLINEACVAAKRPAVFGDASGWQGWIHTVVPGTETCLRCIEQSLPASDATQAAPAGPLAGAIGALQALEAIKLLAGVGEPLAAEVLRLDGLTLAATREPVVCSIDCTCAHG